MKAKRILSVLLTLVMLAAVVTAIPMEASALTTVTITTTNPVILADVGESVDLSLYAVQFGSTTAAAGTLTWSDGSKTITTFKPNEKGVTKLIATKDSNTKNIYVVAKNPSDTDYVLYENDFDSVSSWADLEAEGWKNVTGAPITVDGGVLHIDARGIDVQQTMLPDWFKEFGDYQITAIANETSVKDSSRWCSIVYRCGDKLASSKHYYPFYHMCVRANTTSSTIEFAERTASDGWNVISKKGYTVNMTKEGTYHELTVRAAEEVVEYLLDGESVFFTKAATSFKSGAIGFATNYGIMNIDSVRVTVQAEKPSRPAVAAELVNSSLNRTESNVTNYVSNHAVATTATLDSVLNASVLPAGVIVDLTGKNVTAADLTALLTKIAAKNVIPEFKMDTKAQVDALSTALTDSKVPEALVVSEDTEIVKYARNKKKTVIRGAVDYTGLASIRLTDEEIYDLYQKAAGANAQIVILPSVLATKANVAQFQIYELGVWAYGTGVDTDTEAAWLIASGANAVVSDNVALIASAQKTVFTETNSLTRTPVWTAHRGYFASVPENSMAAFRAGYENGADQLECDIHLTSDGVLVICHDSTIDRTYNGTGSIANMTYEQLKQYRMLHNGKATDEVIPTFEELLQYCKDKDVKILCELKSSQAKLAPEAVALVKKYGMESQVMFISFSEGQLTKVKQYINVSTGDLNPTAGGADVTEIEATLNSYKTAQTTALTYHSTLAMNYSGITQEFIRDANDRGMTIWSWTYTSSTQTQVCNNFLYGMNGMTTNATNALRYTVKTISAPTKLFAESGNNVTYALTSTTYGRVTKDITKNAKVIVLDNDGVVEFTSAGTVKALKDGTATFMLAYTTKLPNSTSYTLYTQPITVTVGEITELMLKDSSSYKLNGDVLTNVPEKVTKAAFIENFENGNAMKLFTPAGKEVTSDTALIPSGTIISYNGAEVTVIVKGDVNSDGKVDAFDYMMVKCSVLKTLEFNGLQDLTGDVNGSGNVDAFDYQMVKAHVLGSYNLYA